jgi:hypothetical protein
VANFVFLAPLVALGSGVSPDKTQLRQNLETTPTGVDFTPTRRELTSTRLDFTPTKQDFPPNRQRCSKLLYFSSKDKVKIPLRCVAKAV